MGRVIWDITIIYSYILLFTILSTHVYMIMYDIPLIIELKFGIMFEFP